MTIDADDFEAQREANIAKNKALLASLDLKSNSFITHEKPRAQKKPKAKLAKRKVDAIEDDDRDAVKPAKKAAVAVADGETGSVRRSGRNAGKEVDYRGDGDHLSGRRGPQIVSEAARKAAARESEPKTNEKRKHDP